MKKLITICAVVMVVAVMAQATTQNVNTLGASSGWYSDDTRNASGTVLNGLNSSYPPYFLNVPGTAADDVAIAQQISFTDAGVYAGAGVMILDGTTANNGKSSVKYYNLNGLSTGANLVNFTSTYRWYMDNYTTSRTPALSLVVLGADSVTRSLAYVGEGSQTQSWNTFTVNASTTVANPSSYGWRLYGEGAPGGTVDGKSLNDWLADATYGNWLSGGTVIAQGFNIGSWQRQCRVGIDYLESSLLNGGEKVNFIPEPATMALLGLGGLLLRRKK